MYPVEKLKDQRFPSAALLLMARQFGHKEGQGFADSRYLRNIHHNIGYYVFRDSTAAYGLIPMARNIPTTVNARSLTRSPASTGCSRLSRTSDTGS